MQKKDGSMKNWNILIYKLTRFYYFWQIFNPFVFIGLIIYIVYLKQPIPSPIQISPAIVVENGKVSRLACDSDDIAFKSVATAIAENLAESIFAYNSESAYAAKTAAMGINFDSNSQAASKFHDLIVKNIELTKSGNSAQFNIDKNSIKAGSLPTNYAVYIILLSGIQLKQTKAGTTTEIKNLSVTFEFNKERGRDGQIFKIKSFDPNFSSI